MLDIVGCCWAKFDFCQKCWILLDVVGQSLTLVKNVGYRWMLLGDAGMVWPPYLTKSPSLKRNVKTRHVLNSFSWVEGSWVRFAVGECHFSSLSIFWVCRTDLLFHYFLRYHPKISINSFSFHLKIII